jgi:predicted ABC-class ATPase
MKSADELQNTIHRIDGRGYKAYKDIEGVYNFGEYDLYIDHVQGDPFASPSRIRVRVPQDIAAFPPDTSHSRSREIALRDFITRLFYGAAKRISRGNRGTGKSGEISIERPGQEVLERTSAFVTGDYVETRFLMGLPAFGRRIAARHAIEMFFNELPEIIRTSMFFKNLDRGKLYEHIETAEDADHLREELGKLNLVSFVADGAILPRRSGIDSRPLHEGNVVSFESPESLSVKIKLPNGGDITGMGIPRGITLIVGGGYHGKSTILNALELGIYNHLPGDGREFVVSNPQTVKIRAEDGRRIEKTCISPFISNLPFGKDTVSFSTDDASGSTSQAANIIEATELGCQVLLIDEDTSATNFMIRDHRMQELVSKQKEPITPFVDKVKLLYRDRGISTILVIGGSGDYFDVADLVICMMEYRPHDVTAESRAIAEKYRAERLAEGGDEFGEVIGRIPLIHSFDPSRGRREVKINSKGLQSIAFGRHLIDLGAIEQLVDINQTRAIGDAIQYARKYMDGKRTLSEIIAMVLQDIEKRGLDVLSSRPVGDYALFRGLELGAAINRLRTLEVKQGR